MSSCELVMIVDDEMAVVISRHSAVGYCIADEVCPNARSLSIAVSDTSCFRNTVASEGMSAHRGI